MRRCIIYAVDIEIYRERERERSCTSLNMMLAKALTAFLRPHSKGAATFAVIVPSFRSQPISSEPTFMMHTYADSRSYSCMLFMPR